MKLRRGIAIPLVLTLGGGLALLIFGVMNYSGNEIKWVSRLMDTKQAEYLAYAGINFAASELQKGRWYQPPDGPYVNWGKTEKTPFGANGGKFTVMCVESTRKIDCKGQPLYENYRTPKAPRGYVSVHVVTSVKIYALGEKDDDKVLIFGRFIMSPEPVLQSNSTDAPGSGKSQGSFSTNEIEIYASADVQQEQADGAQETVFKVSQFLKQPGQEIRGNERIIELLPGSTVSTKRFYPCAEVDGKIKRFLVQPGQMVRVGEPIAIMETKCGTYVPSTTLKKMIQITKIDLRKYAGQIKKFDINDINVLNKIWEDLNKEYLQSFTKNFNGIFNNPQTYESILTNLDKAPDLTVPKVSSSIPASPQSPAAESEFILEMFKGFFPPGRGMNPDSQEAKEFASKAKFNLSHRPRNLKPETEEACRIFAGEGGSEFKRQLEDTVPKREPPVCEINGTDGYLGKMKTLGDQKFSETAPPPDLIKSLTYLERAKSKGTILYDNGTPYETKELALANAPNGASYKFVPSKNGWYPPPDFTFDGYSDAFYTYENGDIKLRVDYILNFIKKHYSDDGSFPVGKDQRLGADQEDEPQAPGPPDITGRRTSDGC